MTRKSRALPPSPFRRFNSSPEVIRLVVMMYVKYPLSLRNVEDLLFERGISGRLSVQLGRGVLWLGRISGFGLILIGLGFVIYGVFVAPRVFAGPLSNAEIDAQTWTTANILAHMLMAAGTLLGRALNPFWLLLLGRRLFTV